MLQFASSFFVQKHHVHPAHSFEWHLSNAKGVNILNAPCLLFIL